MADDNFIRAPFIYDSLDRPNADSNSKLQSYDSKNNNIKVTIDYKFILACILLLIVGIFSLYFLHERIMIDIDRSNFGRFSVFIIAQYALIYSIYLLPVALLIVSIYAIVSQIRINNKRAQLVNIMQHQTTIDRIHSGRLHDEHDALAEFLGVARVRAENSTYAGAQNITLDLSNSRNNAESSPSTDITHPTTETEKMQGEELPALLELRARGLINRSDDSLLIGFTRDTEIDDSI